MLLGDRFMLLFMQGMVRQICSNAYLVKITKFSVTIIKFYFYSISLTQSALCFHHFQSISFLIQLMTSMEVTRKQPFQLAIQTLSLRKSCLKANSHLLSTQRESCQDLLGSVVSFCIFVDLINMSQALKSTVNRIMKRLNPSQRSLNTLRSLNGTLFTEVPSRCFAMQGSRRTSFAFWRTIPMSPCQRKSTMLKEHKLEPI